MPDPALRHRGFEPTCHKTSGFDKIGGSDFERRASAGPEGPAATMAAAIPPSPLTRNSTYKSISYARVPIREMDGETAAPSESKGLISKNFLSSRPNSERNCTPASLGPADLNLGVRNRL